jgi:hypothetical protein
MLDEYMWPNWDYFNVEFKENLKEMFGLGGPPQTQVSGIRCPLLQLLLFSLEYAS